MLDAAKMNAPGVREQASDKAVIAPVATTERRLRIASTPRSFRSSADQKYRSTRTSGIDMTPALPQSSPEW